MKTNILLILSALFTSNAFAQTDLSAKNIIDTPSQQTGATNDSSNKILDDNGNNASLLEKLKVPIEQINDDNLSLNDDPAKLDNAIGSLDYKFHSLQDNNIYFTVILNDLKRQVSELEGELNKSTQGNTDFELHLSSLEKKYNLLSINFTSYKQDFDDSIASFHEIFSANIENNKQLNSQIILLQEESYKLREYNDNLKKSFIDLDGKYQQLSTNITTYRKDTNNTFNSTLQKIYNNSAYINKAADDLGTRIASSIKISNSNIAELRQTTRQQNKYFIAAFIAVVLLMLFIFFFLRKQMVKQQDDFMVNLRKLRQSLEEDGAGHDQKLTEIIEAQLTILNSGNSAIKEEPDHSLALKVADEIIRIQKNLSHMDAKTRGWKQLTASVKRIRDNFSSHGYELVEMLGQPYKDGMKASVNFIPDDKLEDGQQIITRITKPQVNYKDVIIQTAQIEVSLGG